MKKKAVTQRRKGAEAQRPQPERLATLSHFPQLPIQFTHMGKRLLISRARAELLIRDLDSCLTELSDADA